MKQPQPNEPLKIGSKVAVLDISGKHFYTGIIIGTMQGESIYYLISGLYPAYKAENLKLIE